MKKNAIAIVCTLLSGSMQSMDSLYPLLEHAVIENPYYLSPTPMELQDQEFMQAWTDSILDLQVQELQAIEEDQAMQQAIAASLLPEAFDEEQPLIRRRRPKNKTEQTESNASIPVRAITEDEKAVETATIPRSNTRKPILIHPNTCYVIRDDEPIGNAQTFDAIVEQIQSILEADGPNENLSIRLTSMNAINKQINKSIAKQVGALAYIGPDVICSDIQDGHFIETHYVRNRVAIKDNFMVSQGALRKEIKSFVRGLLADDILSTWLQVNRKWLGHGYYISADTLATLNAYTQMVEHLCLILYSNQNKEQKARDLAQLKASFTALVTDIPQGVLLEQLYDNFLETVTN